MTGTEKQIAWANKIKASIMPKATAVVHHAKQVALHCSSMDAYKASLVCDRFDNVLETLEMIHQASWWIDRRNDDVSDLVECVANWKG